MNRRYHGYVMVVVDDGLKQGFIFEPGQVELEYQADPDKHPREKRTMRMIIHGDGRMAAALELQQDHHDHRGERQQEDQKQLPVREELPPASG